jgi:mannose-6-phosphate isomerase-like protein (cupin superfamily)
MAIDRASTKAAYAPETERALGRLLTDEETSALGIRTRHEIMPSGERRFRLVAASGSSYVRTEATARGGWQNSHLHRGSLELYLVERGWIALARKPVESGLEVTILEAGQMLSVPPGEPHNVFLPPDAIMHTIKQGPGGQGDWEAAPDLDLLTRNIPADELRRGR